MSPLPTELTDQILSSLSQPFDYVTLCSASLVCRKWTLLAHRYLFSSVHVRLSRRKLVEFAQLLRSLPYLGSHIRSLHIEGNPPTSVVQMQYDEFITVIRQLTRLQDLTLRRLLLPNDPKIAPHLSLRRLTYTYTIASRRPHHEKVIAGLFCFLRAFSAVEELRLGVRLTPWGIDAEPQQSVLPLPKLPYLGTTSLVVTSGSTPAFSETFLPALQHTRVHDALVALHVDFGALQTINIFAPTFSQFISNPSCKLQRLSLGFKIHVLDRRFAGTAEEQADVTRCLHPAIRSLHTLRTFCLVVDLSHCDDTIWEAVLFPLLEALPSSVATVHLYINAENGDNSPRFLPAEFPFDVEQLTHAVARHTALTDVRAHIYSLQGFPQTPFSRLVEGKWLHIDVWDGHVV